MLGWAGAAGGEGAGVASVVVLAASASVAAIAGSAAGTTASLDSFGCGSVGAVSTGVATSVDSAPARGAPEVHEDMASVERAHDGADALSALRTEEIRELIKASDARGFAAVFTTWGLIAGSLASVALAPGFWKWPVGLLSLVVLGGRHLALAILMHEASHHSLFRTRALNDAIGAWLCAYPAWQDVRRYRVHHLAHHKFAGTERDPDFSLVTGFPTSRRSLARKIARDLFGITGVKRIFGLVAMGATVVNPVEGLGMGEQLQFYQRECQR